MRAPDNIDVEEATTIEYALHQSKLRAAKSAMRSADVIAFVAILVSLIPGVVLFVAPGAALAMIICGIVAAVNGRVISGVLYCVAIPPLVFALCWGAQFFTLKYLFKRYGSPIPALSEAAAIPDLFPPTSDPPPADPPPATRPPAEPKEIEPEVAPEPIVPFVAMRIWTNADGRTLEAELIAILSADEGRFRKRDGSTFEYAFDKLIEADMEIIYAAADEQKRSQGD